MAYVETWDETKPAGSRDANLGDDDIRECKRAIRERLAGGGMNFPSTDDSTAGLFNNVKFIEQSSNPTFEANRAFLFTKDVSSVTELYWMDSAGTVTQLTSGGKLLISSLVIASEARGDLIIRGATAWGRTALGAKAKVVRSDGTDAVWGNVGDPKVSAHKNGTNQTGVVTGTNTLVTLGTEVFDSDANFASNRFTPTTAGNYLLIGCVNYTSAVDQTNMAAYIFKNGALSHCGPVVNASGTGGHGCMVVAVEVANGSTDYFELYTQHNAGSDRTIDGAANATYLMAIFIGA